jgi:hypothetical protein
MSRTTPSRAAGFNCAALEILNNRIRHMAVVMGHAIGDRDDRDARAGLAPELLDAVRGLASEIETATNDIEQLYTPKGGAR